MVSERFECLGVSRYARHAVRAFLVFVAACALGLTHAAVAGSPEPPVVIEAQPLTHTREGRVQGCGLRLTGGAPGTPASSWFDVSFNVFARGMGLVQSIAYELRRSEIEGDSRPAKVPVRSTWVRTGEGSARRGETSERRDSLVYTLLVEDVLALFEAVAESRAVTLGVRRWDQPFDAVYTGTPVLSADSRIEVSACLDRLMLE